MCYANRKLYQDISDEITELGESKSHIKKSEREKIQVSCVKLHLQSINIVNNS